MFQAKWTFDMDNTYVDSKLWSLVIDDELKIGNLRLFLVSLWIFVSIMNDL